MKLIFKCRILILGVLPVLNSCLQQQVYKSKWQANDFSNLSYSHLQESMDFYDNKSKLQYNMTNDYKNKNIFTSYWISDISNNNLPFLSQQILKKEIQFKMNKYHFNVISAYYKMYPFLHKYFDNYNIHLWTNGLITESDKSQIEELSYNQDVKVILVDYKDNFLFSNKPGF